MHLQIIQDQKRDRPHMEQVGLLSPDAGRSVPTGIEQALKVKKENVFLEALELRAFDLQSPGLVQQHPTAAAICGRSTLAALGLLKGSPQVDSLLTIKSTSGGRPSVPAPITGLDPGPS